MKKDCVVIWSAFFDSFIVEVLHRIGPRIEVKVCGTREECAAWIARQR